MDTTLQAAVVAAMRILDRRPAPTALRQVVETIRPGGYAKYVQDASRHGELQALTAILANSYAQALVTQKLPGWMTPRPNGGLGGLMSGALSIATGGISNLFGSGSLTDKAVAVATGGAFDSLKEAQSGLKAVACTPGAISTIGTVGGAIASIWTGPVGAAVGKGAGSVGQGIVGATDLCKQAAATTQQSSLTAAPKKVNWLLVGGVAAGVVVVGTAAWALTR